MQTCLELQRKQCLSRLIDSKYSVSFPLKLSLNVRATERQQMTGSVLLWKQCRCNTRGAVLIAQFPKMVKGHSRSCWHFKCVLCLHVNTECGRGLCAAPLRVSPADEHKHTITLVNRIGIAFTVYLVQTASSCVTA